MPTKNIMSPEERAVHDQNIQEVSEKKGYPICGARNRQGWPCGNKAGKGTDHLGLGRCDRHGGKNQSPSAKNFKHGLSSQISYPGLKEEVARLAKDRDVFDLREHIYLMEAIGNELLKKASTADDLFPVVKVITEASKIIQRLHEIEVGRKYVVSVETVDNITTRLVEAVERHVADPYTRGLIAQDIMNVKVATTPVIDVTPIEVDDGED